MPDDLKGLNMRVNNFNVLSDMFASLGANPHQRPVAALWTPLETGVVDAQDHPIGIVLSIKFNDVQKYLFLIQHAYSLLALVVKAATFNNLTADQQKVNADVDAAAFQAAVKPDWDTTIAENGAAVVAADQAVL